MTETDLEVDLLLEALHKKSDYDFRNYARPHIMRRIEYRRKTNSFNSISEMISPVIHDVDFRETLLQDLSINVTEMFRDPDFYKSIRTHIVPIVKKKDFFTVWHAGCSTGEEVYSHKILLSEELESENYKIFGTDFNKRKLVAAKKAIYPINKIKEYTKNYQNAACKGSFSDYYTAHFQNVQLNKNLKQNLTFSFHNLVNDPFFTSIDVIFCRNVLIYFDKELQNSVLKRFYNSLNAKGYLCLGSKETLQFSEVEENFEVIDHENRIYRKI